MCKLGLHNEKPPISCLLMEACFTLCVVTHTRIHTQISRESQSNGEVLHRSTGHLNHIPPFSQLFFCWLSPSLSFLKLAAVNWKPMVWEYSFLTVSVSGRKVFYSSSPHMFSKLNAQVKPEQCREPRYSCFIGLSLCSIVNTAVIFESIVTVSASWTAGNKIPPFLLCTR